VRKGVHFHDGSALTAQDVAYSIARNVQPNGQSPVVGLLGPYLSPKNITTPGAYTVKLQLHAPYGFLPLELGNRYMRVIKSGTTSFTKAIGTGPYKLKSFVPGQTLAVTRNASYWRTPPLLQGIVSENIPSSASLVEALLVGNVDAIESVDFSQVSQIRGSHGHKLIVLPDQYIPSIDFDVLVKPYNDPRVLEAIKLSVNRPQLINTVYQGLATVGYDVPVPSSDPYFGNLPKPEYNPQKAKQLLAAAGYASGLDVKLIVSPVGPSMVEFGEAIAAQLAAAGINMSIQTWPTGTFWNQVWLKAPACTPIYLRRPANEILTYIGSPHGAFNGTHWSNRTFDKELTAALRTASPGRQRADFRVAESIESKSGGNLMPVFAAELAASSTRVQVAPSRVQLLDFS
jgi:peptide/nickel transport system substrate-binding protein